MSNVNYVKGSKTQVSLASTHPNLRFLMPKEQNVAGEDFDEEGPYDGHFCPETYMDVPVLTRGLISVKMSFQWKDQACCRIILLLLYKLFSLLCTGVDHHVADLGWAVGLT